VFASRSKQANFYVQENYEYSAETVSGNIATLRLVIRDWQLHLLYEHVLNWH